jgi:hypothetical protein
MAGMFHRTKHDKIRQNQEFNLYPLAVFSGKLFRDARQKKYYMFWLLLKLK